MNPNQPSSPTQPPQPPSQTIPLLSPLNPRDYLRFVWWLFFFPQDLTAYQNAHGKEALDPISNWFTSTLIWLPLFMLTLGLALGRITTAHLPLPANIYGWLCGVLLLAWVLTAWSKRMGEEKMKLQVAVGAGVGVTSAVASGVMSIALAGWSGQVATMVASGVAGVVAGVVTQGINNGLEEGFGNLSTIGAVLALIISYVFLIWFCFLGGAAALGQGGACKPCFW